MKKLFPLIGFLAAWCIVCSKLGPVSGTITDEDTGTLTVKVTYRDSILAPEIRIRLYHLDATDSPNKPGSLWQPDYIFTSDSNGAFRFELKEGLYTIEAIGAFAGAMDTVAIASSGMTTRPLTLRSFGAVKGRIDSGLALRHTSLSVVIPQINRKAPIDANGGFCINDLAPFTYTLRLITGDSLLTDSGSVCSIDVQPGQTVFIDRFGASEKARPLVAPSVPQGLDVVSITAKTVALTWNPSAMATGYILFRYNEGRGSFDTVSRLSGTSGLDSGVLQGKSYTYAVIATNSAGISEKSATVASTVPLAAQTKRFPIIHQTAPAYYTAFLNTDVIHIRCSATETDKHIASTIVTLDGAFFASSAGKGPFDWTIGPLNIGIHSIRITSIDVEGDSTVSMPELIIVDNKRLGDVNSDGVVDADDALDVSRYAVDLLPLRFNVIAADVDCNGAIDIVDALLIAQYHTRIIDVFPCYTK